MKTVAALSALMASSACAFAPAANKPSVTSLNAEMPDRLWDTMVDKSERSEALPFLPRPANLDGSMVGDKGFDPFYLSSIPKDFSGFIQPPQWEERGSIPTLYWMREAELKHGRVCMLAWAGWVAVDGGFGPVPLRFPAEIYSVDSVANAQAAHDVFVAQGSMGFGLAAIAFIEFCTGAVLVEVAKGENDRAAGDFSLDPLSFLKGKSEDEVNLMKLKEIEHCRLAMLAFAGVATQSSLVGGNAEFPYF